MNYILNKELMMNESWMNVLEVNGLLKKYQTFVKNQRLSVLLVCTKYK